MAITLGDVLVMIRGDRSQLGSDLGAAEHQTRGWAANLGGTVLMAVGGAVAAGAAAAASAVVGIGTAALSVSGQIDRATDNMVARLGMSQEQAERFADVITQVYGDGFAGSIEEAGMAVEQVFQNLGEMAWDLTQDEMATMTEQALALSDAYGVEVSESLRSAGILMANMGVTGDEAMAMIAAGFQNGLNRADDLLDTFNEYADDFRDFGMTGEETLGFLNRGLEAGIFNTDRMGDAINEFGVNLRDPAIRDGLYELDAGLGAIYDQFAEGAITEREAFEQIVAGLRTIEDPIARDTAGVLFFRSMWEDLGEEAIFALGDMESGLIDVAGATEALNQQYDNLGSFFEGMRRRLTLALAPLGDRLLEMVNQAMPTIEEWFTELEAQLPWILDIVEQTLGRAGDFIMTSLLPGLRSLFEIARLFVTGDFRGGIFNWAEDSSQIDFLFRIRNGFLQLVETIQSTVIPFFQNTLWPTLQSVFGHIVGVLQNSVIPFFQNTLWPTLQSVFGHIVGVLQNSVIPFFQNTLWPTLQSVFGHIVGVLQDSVIPFFQNTLWPALRSIFNFIVTNIPTVIQAISPLASALWELGRFIINELVPIFSEFGGEVLAIIGETLGEVGLEIGAGPGGGLAGLLAGLAAFITGTLIPVLREWVPVILDEVLPGIRQLAQWIGDIAGAVLPLLGQAFGFVTEHLNIILPILGVVGGVILALSSPILAVIAAIVLLATAWANNWGDIQGRTGAVVDWFNANIRPTFERIFGWITGEALPFLRDLWQTVWSGIQAVIERVLPIIQAIVAAFQAAFRGDWEGFGTLLRDAWDMAWQLIGDVLRGAGELFLTLLQNAVDAIWRLITETDWLGLGRRILEGIANGIRNAVHLVTDAATGAVQTALDAARGFLRIRSPSGLFADEVGMEIPPGIAQGIRRTAGSVRDALLGALNLQNLAPQWSMAGAAAGGGSEIHVHFNGGQGAPQTHQEAEDRAFLIANALRARGVD